MFLLRKATFFVSLNVYTLHQTPPYMKTILVYSVCFLLFFSSFAHPVANYDLKFHVAGSKPYNEVFGRFHAHRQHNGIALTWYTINVENVNSFIIERSYDGIYFENIDEVAVSNSADNHYNDNQVFPGYLYYRIGAVMNDGTILYSDIEMIRIVSRKGW